MLIIRKNRFFLVIFLIIWVISANSKIHHPSQRQDKVLSMDQIAIQRQRIKFMQQYKEHGPDKYFIISTIKFTLSPEVIQVKQEQNGRKKLISNDQLKGYELPCFYCPSLSLYYEGQWLNKKPNGKGKVYYDDGHYFQGIFSQGEAQTNDGLFVFNDGSFYRGALKKSKFWGKGVFCSKNGLKYEGKWESGKPDGQGKQTFAKGNIYEGYFKNGFKDGSGKFTWSNGLIFQGQFAKGKINGKGKLSKSNNIYYEGGFRQNKKQGQGIMKTALGVYKGFFSKGFPQGLGTFTWRKGQIYEGQFSKGKPNGEGIFYFSKKKFIKGFWTAGKLTKINTQIKTSKLKKSTSKIRKQ